MLGAARFRIPRPDAVAEKTAGLFVFATWAGAIAGTEDADVADHAGSVGRLLGLAYQAFDDCMDARAERDAIMPAAALPVHLSHARDERGLSCPSSWDFDIFGRVS